MKNEKNTSGLNVPHGYFENFEDSVMLRVMEDSFPKNTGFKTPDGYFDGIEDRLTENVITREETKVISIFRNTRLLYVAGVAACVVLIVALFNGFGSELSIEDISVANIEEYINEGGMDIDSYDVFALLNDEEISELHINTELFSEESLENYLIENIDETSLLIE